MKHENHCGIERLLAHYLGTGTLMGLAGLVWLVNTGRTPEGHIIALVGIVSGGFGAIAGMATTLLRGAFTGQPTGEPDDPLSMKVTNTDAEPVPTTVEKKP